MTVQTPPTAERIEKLQGLGCARKRVEDARFTQGKGNYVDDIKMSGMLFGDFVRSPYGHARIKAIDTSAALAVPGVKAVLTAADLKPLSLHYMPTLAGDVQAVLADEKVLFQGQEVAFVIAENRYAAADAIELVDVDYEELPALVDPQGPWMRTRRSCARTSRTRPRAPMGRAGTQTTYSPGRWATPRRQRRYWPELRSWPRK